MKLIIILVVICMFGFIGNAFADAGFGLKAGLGINPDQLVIGGQLSLTESLGIFRIVPNAEIGIFDNTIIVLNLDLLAFFKSKDASFGFYAGGAPTVTLLNNSGIGITGVAGLQLGFIKNMPTNLELRIGIGNNVPDFRILMVFIL